MISWNHGWDLNYGARERASQKSSYHSFQRETSGQRTAHHWRYSSRSKESMIIPMFWLRRAKLRKHHHQKYLASVPLQKSQIPADELGPSRPVSNIPGYDCQWRTQVSPSTSCTWLQCSPETRRSLCASGDVLHPHDGSSPPTASSRTVSLHIKPSTCSPPRWSLLLWSMLPP